MYKALYRKYRPLTFDDVISQPHVTKTLLNQIKNGKTAHAYLFTGSRGTGKTTCARILAKAINCEHPIDGNPCLECDICRDAEIGALSDIIEIDAASNNGVDDVRDLRDGAIYTPERCKYKIYIIDEVHMLSKEAFNALLKIMEEPPAHVKFILATTEIHKVLPTILSRCQRFDFRRILPADITARLLEIAQKENITLSQDAAELIAKTADGGMRDALSLLDQCIAYSDNITAETVSNAAGIAGRDYLFDIIEAIADGDTCKAVTVTDRLYSMSKDMQRLCDELITQFRNVMMAKSVPENTDIIVCMPDELTRIKAIAQKMSLSEILLKLELLQSCNERLSRSSSKRVEFEMCLIRLCSAGILNENNAKTVDNSDIYAKIEMLENKLSNVQDNTAKYSRTSPQRAETARPVPESQQKEQGGDVSKLRAEDFTPLSEWAEVLENFEKVCPSVSGTLHGSKAMQNQNFLLVYTENAFFIQLLKVKENAEKLRDSVKAVTGKTFRILAKCTASEDTPGAKVQDILKKAKENNIPTDFQNK